jgi:hypothetical protein
MIAITLASAGWPQAAMYIVGIVALAAVVLTIVKETL